MLFGWLIALAGPVVGALLAFRATAPRDARARASAGAGAGVLGSLALWLAPHGAPDFLGFSALLASSDSEGWAAALPAFVSAITLTAVAMSPLGADLPRTLARTLLVSACSVALVTIDDPFALATLWTLSMVPAWLELRSEARSRPTAKVFALYMLPSSVAMMAAAFLGQRGAHEMAFIAAALSIGLRGPVFPLHSWFPAFVERAPLSLVVVFAAPQLAAFAHLRAWPAGLPEGYAEAATTVAASTAVLAALLGAVQTRARRGLAYLMMSQMALVTVGLSASSDVMHVGARVTWMLVGLATTGYAMTLGALEARRGPLGLDGHHGNFARIPFLATSMLVLGLASVGLPCTLGHISEELLVTGAAAASPGLALAMIAAISINVANVARTYFALCTGTAKHEGERDLTRRERLVLGVLVAAIIAAGVLPDAVVRPLDVRRGVTHGARRSSRSAVLLSAATTGGGRRVLGVSTHAPELFLERGESLVR